MARTDRCAGRVRVRTRRRCAVRRSTHDRNGDRAAAAGGEIHPLHGRNQSAARRPRIRVHEHAQRCLEPDLRAGVDAGDWRRRHRGAGGFGLQRVWLASATLPSRPANSADGRRRYFGGRRLRVSRRGDRRSGELRRDRIVRENAKRRAHELPARTAIATARKRRSRSWPSAGRRTRPG